MTLPLNPPAETMIKLNAEGALVLVLPGKDGFLFDITLQSGKVEAILLALLAAQSAKSPAIGRSAGPSWRFLLESGLLATSKVTKVAQGARASHLSLDAKRNAEDLGL